MTIAETKQPKTNYSVKHIEMVVKGADVVARIFTLAPGDVIPWHYHSESDDHYFVLEGALRLNTREPDVEALLAVGEKYRITPGVRHQVSNAASSDTRFLLLQGVGKYDWLKG